MCAPHFSHHYGMASKIEDENQPLGLLLKSLRVSQGTSQAHVAAALGISGSAVSQIESGKSRPSVDRLKDFAAAAGGELLVRVLAPNNRAHEVLRLVAVYAEDFDELQVETLLATLQLWGARIDEAAAPAGKMAQG